MTTENERLAGAMIINDVWLAEVKAMALVGDESSVDVLRLLEGYSDTVSALRRAVDSVREFVSTFRMHLEACPNCEGCSVHRARAIVGPQPYEPIAAHVKGPLDFSEPKPNRQPQGTA